MLFPCAARNLVGDKIVGGFAIGNAQQRFRETHQDDAFVARKAILVHEGVDACVLTFVEARGVNQPACVFAGTAALVLGEYGALDQTAGKAVLVD